MSSRKPAPDVWKSITSKLKPDPITGRLDNSDILTFLREHENDPELQQALQNSEEEGERRERETDFDTFDYAALAKDIKPMSIWRVTMEYSGLVDPETDFIVEPHELKEFPNAHHSFRVTVNFPNKDGFLDQPEIRYIQDFKGLPKSADVLLFLKKTFATPISVLKPELPSMLMITHQFQPHRAVLAPFLDSLPAPFSWVIGDAQSAELMSQVQYSKAMHFFKDHMANGESWKENGNKAFKRGDRKAALAAYTQALRRFEDAHCQKVLEEHKKEAMRMMAITIANRSATALLPGEGQDVTLAINDGKKAIFANPSYAKGYARFAKAYWTNGDLSEAQDALADGLRLPQLENEVGLVDVLIDMQTDGKGLPADDEEFKKFAQRILREDKESAKRVKDIKGLWRKRITDRLRKPSLSVES